MNIKSFTQQYQLLSYFVFAYGITWSGIFILLVSKGFDFTTIHTPEVIFIFLMMWVYSNTQSLLVAQLMHASYTGWLYVLSPAVSFDRGLLWQGIFAASLSAIVAIVFAAGQKTLFLKGSE